MIKFNQLQKLARRPELNRFISSKYSDNIADFVQDLDLSINKLLQVDFNEARKYIRRARAIFRHLPDEYEPRLLAIKGRYHLFTGDYKTALKYYRKGVDLFKRAGNAYGVARLGKALLEVYNRLGMYKLALETGRNSLRYYRRKNLPVDVGHVLNNMGNVYHRMDNNRMALSYYDKTKEIVMKYGGVNLSGIEFNRANILANMNQIGKARALYEKAASIYHEEGRSVAENKTYYALAFLLFLDDRFTESIRLFEKTYDKSKDLGDPVGAANNLLDMAEVNIQLNQYGSAIMISEQIIPEFNKSGMKYEEARARYFASDARIRLGDYDPAAVQLKQAERLFASLGNNLWLGMVNIARSKLQLARKRYKQAIKAATDSRAFFIRSGDERRRIDAEIALIEAVHGSRDYDRALKLAMPLKKRKLISSQSHKISLLIGKCHYDKEEYSEALKYFRAAIRTIEKMLEGLYPDEIRFFFIVDKYDSYQMMIDCLLKLGRVRDSFVTNLKALEVINHRPGLEKKLKREVSPDLVEKRNALRAALKKLNQTPKGEQRGAATQKSYYSIEHRLWSNERKIRTVLYPREEFRDSGVLADYRDIFKYIARDETVVSFFSSRNITGAYCASNGRVNFVRYDMTPKELDVMLRKLHFIYENAVFGQRDVVRTRQISEHYLAIIYKKIIGPILPSLAGRKIIFMADGSFSQIPFMALRDDKGSYLKDKYEMRIIVNPEDLRRRTNESKNLKKLRNAVFAVSSNLLPLIDIEARQIKNIFRKSRLYIGDAADCLNLTNELREADGIVHIAAHASRSSENPLFSRILMHDGPYFPFDLFQSGVKAELVTLSGCQTAAPGLYYGNSFSLAKAFYQAGSHHVLATLWPVSDKLSMLFMIDFYETLARGGDVYKAYQSAISQIIKVTDNPAFWSSFVLLGT